MFERMRVAVVRTIQADALLRRLWSLGLVDRAVRITKRGHEVLIPLRGEPGFSLEPFGARVEAIVELVVRSPAKNPHDVLRGRFRDAKLRDDLIPTRWEWIGEIVVLRLPSDAQPHASDIARLIGEVLGAKAVVEDVSGVHGPLRTPEIRILWGSGTETIHTEGGIRYALDVARIMFSSGNLAERVGIAARIRPGQVVVDLFAGIGYFSIPIAVRSRPARVYACEVSPVAYGYLLENVRLNRATNVVPLLGDCRDTAPSGVADWVLMGHFSATDYLDVAFRAMKDVGTVVYHCVAPAERFPKEAIERIREAGAHLDFEIGGIHSRRVKSYAPGILHGVVEASVARRPKGISRENPSGGAVRP